MTSSRPNVVLVTVDSLRADHCGFGGYDEDTTPTLDAMADEGVVFENAVAPGPSTPESMPAIFTGQYPVERPGEIDRDSELEAKRRRIQAHMAARDTLPEKFGRLGYETAAFTPNPFTSRHFGFDQGFDHFRDFMDATHRGRIYRTAFEGFLEGRTVASLARVLVNFWQREEVFKPWESYYDEVIEWAEEVTEPFFLWVFLMDAHNPYTSPGEYRSQANWKEFHANVEFWRGSHETPFSETVHERLVTAYDDAVRYCDAFLERLRADLGGENTVIAVHGDHGEAFGEHGTYGHEPYLHEENLHVPVVVDGRDAAPITDPFSLCRLPELLTGVADGSADPAGLTGPFAVARSDADERTAVHGDGWTCLSEASELTASGRAATSTGEDGALRTCCERLLERHSADQRERRIVSRVAGERKWSRT